MSRSEISHDCDPLLIDGNPIDTSIFTATRAKNEFGRMLDMVIEGRAVVITKQKMRKAVLISYDEFMALAGKGARQLNSLRAEFDELLVGMQTPESRAGMKAAFNASPSQLKKAADDAVRKHG